MPVRLCADDTVNLLTTTTNSAIIILLFCGYRIKKNRALHRAGLRAGPRAGLSPKKMEGPSHPTIFSRGGS